jgi:hypothetical protein
MEILLLNEWELRKLTGAMEWEVRLALPFHRLNVLPVISTGSINSMHDSSMPISGSMVCNDGQCLLWRFVVSVG